MIGFIYHGLMLIGLSGLVFMVVMAFVTWLENHDL